MNQGQNLQFLSWLTPTLVILIGYLMKQKFDDIDKRFDKMDVKFDKLENRMAKVEENLSVQNAALKN